MKLFFVLAVTLVSLPASAGCNYIAEYFSDDLELQISDGGCDQLRISFTKEFVFSKEGRFAKPGSGVSYPFDDECTLGSSDEVGRPRTISCHSKGHTPLAGATYLLKLTGKRVRSFDACGEKLAKPVREDVWQYLCVSECKRKGVPAALNPMEVCD